MTSRSERRLACHAAIAPRRPVREPVLPVADPPIVRPGVLDAPELLFVVAVWLAATDGVLDGGLRRSCRAIQTLKPFSCEWRADSVAYEFLCTGVDPEATAWRVIDRVREVTDLQLLRVEVGSADAPEPAAVFTTQRRRCA